MRVECGDRFFNKLMKKYPGLIHNFVKSTDVDPYDVLEYKMDFVSGSMLFEVKVDSEWDVEIIDKSPGITPLTKEICNTRFIRTCSKLVTHSDKDIQFPLTMAESWSKKLLEAFAYFCYESKPVEKKIDTLCDEFDKFFEYVMFLTLNMDTLAISIIRIEFPEKVFWYKNRQLHVKFIVDSDNDSGIHFCMVEQTDSSEKSKYDTTMYAKQMLRFLGTTDLIDVLTE